MVELQEMAAAEPPVWIPSPIWEVGEELDPGQQHERQFLHQKSM